MNIGFDAKWFNAGHPSGRTFTRQLARALADSFPQHKFVFFLKSSDRRLSSPFCSENVTLEYASLGNNLISNVLCLPFAAAKHDLDILITQNFSAPIRAVKQATIVFDVIFRSHADYFTRRERMYFHFIKPLLRFSDGVVTISKYSRNEMRRYGFLKNNHPCFVLYLGVDSRFFDASVSDTKRHQEYASEYKLPPRFVLYVGRLNERKNISNLIRGLTYVEDQSVPLVLVGRRDWKMGDLGALIHAKGLDERVIQIGHVKDEVLPWLYKQASVFAYVSTVEGFGLPPLEAMASGVPVVVSNTSSLPEICGDAAVYVDPSSPEEIGRGLNSVLSNSALSERLRQAGLRNAACYTWEKTASRLMDCVSSLLGGKGE